MTKAKKCNVILYHQHVKNVLYTVIKQTAATGW